MDYQLLVSPKPFFSQRVSWFSMARPILRNKSFRRNNSSRSKSSSLQKYQGYQLRRLARMIDDHCKSLKLIFFNKLLTGIDGSQQKPNYILQSYSTQANSLSFSRKSAFSESSKYKSFLSQKKSLAIYNIYSLVRFNIKKIQVIFFNRLGINTRRQKMW